MNSNYLDKNLALNIESYKMIAINVAMEKSMSFYEYIIVSTGI